MTVPRRVMPWHDPTAVFVFYDLRDMQRLPLTFFRRDTTTVARELVGCLIKRVYADGRVLLTWTNATYTTDVRGRGRVVRLLHLRHALVRQYRHRDERQRMCRVAARDGTCVRSGTAGEVVGVDGRAYGVALR